MTDVQRAKRLLDENGYTCVFVKGESELTSRDRGIKPIMDLISHGVNLKGYSAADKIVGKAAALLYVFAGIAEVYAETVSLAAMQVLKNNNIPFAYGTHTEKIINRRGDDVCPMEKTVLDISAPDKAYEALKKKLQNL